MVAIPIIAGLESAPTHSLSECCRLLHSHLRKMYFIFLQRKSSQVFFSSILCPYPTESDKIWPGARTTFSTEGYNIYSKSRWTACYQFQAQTNGNSLTPEWNVATVIPTITLTNPQTFHKINPKQASNANNSWRICAPKTHSHVKNILSSVAPSCTRATFNQNMTSKPEVSNLLASMVHLGRRSWAKHATHQH